MGRPRRAGVIIPGTFFFSQIVAIGLYGLITAVALSAASEALRGVLLVVVHGELPTHAAAGSPSSQLAAQRHFKGAGRLGEGGVDSSVISSAPAFRCSCAAAAKARTSRSYVCGSWTSVHTWTRSGGSPGILARKSTSNPSGVRT